MERVDRNDGCSPRTGTAETRAPALLYAAANNAYAAGDLARAEGLYRSVLALQAGHMAARNNLAALLLDQARRVT
jgi:hypothetical protein